jgi:hypothetical protein
MGGYGWSAPSFAADRAVGSTAGRPGRPTNTPNGAGVVRPVIVASSFPISDWKELTGVHAGSHGPRHRDWAAAGLRG